MLVTDTSTTLVTFQAMRDEEIDAYLESGEWKGVAGAYRIQRRGALYVRSIEGSYSNVVGLPLSLFYGILRDTGYPF